MIEKGANYLIGWFDCACHGGYIDTVKLLIEKGIRCRNYGLLIACSGGKIDIVRLMIDNGADNLNEALELIRKEKNINEIIKLLIEHGAK